MGNLIVDIRPNASGLGSEPIEVTQVYIQLFMKRTVDSEWLLKKKWQQNSIGEIYLNGAGADLPYGEYDFKINAQIWEAKGVAGEVSKQPSDDDDLKSQKFESESEDK